MNKLPLRLLLIVVLGLFTIGLFAWTLKPNEISKEELQSLGVVVLERPKQVGELDFVGKDGARFDGRELLGRWTFGFFGYTHCPDICPETMTAMAKAVRRLEDNDEQAVLDDIQGLFVSVDSARDGHDRVRKFVDRVNPQFLGVTGEPKKIDEFASFSGIGYRRMGSQEQVDNYLIEHMGYIVIYNPDGALYGYIKPPFVTDHLARVFRGLAQSS